ncbi:MAG TPA: STAS domain-containing protein [Rudaea sp.]|nr:STAS domain-containing protein [Rudaea sp.]
MAIEIQIEQQDQIHILGLTGRLDTETAADVELAFADLLAAKAVVFVVDLSGIGYVSSAGLRVLLALAKKLDGGKGQLYLCGLSPAVRQVFDVAGFSKLFALFPDREAALKKAGKAAPVKSPQDPAPAAESAQLDAAKAQAARKVEAAKQEAERERAAAQAAAAKAQAAKIEAEKAEAATAEAARRESERLEAARREAVKAEAARLQSAKAAAVAQAEAAKLEAEKAEAAKAEAARIQAQRIEAAKLDAANAQAAIAEAARVEAARASMPENVLAVQLYKLLGVAEKAEVPDPKAASLARSAALLLGISSGPSGQVTNPRARASTPDSMPADAAPKSGAPVATSWKDKVRGLFGGKR